MLKIKSFLPVFAAVLILGLSNAAFAQLSCGVASTPVSRATDTGLTEPAGDLIFNCIFVGPAATTTATMTIDYPGVIITNTTSWPPDGPDPDAFGGIRVETATGVPPTIVSVSNSTGQIVLQVPPQGANLTFTLKGVLVALSGTGKTSLSASISVSPGNNVLITAGQNVAVVITSVLPGLRTPVIRANWATGLILGPGLPILTAPNFPNGPNLGGFGVTVPENYIDMYRSAAQFNAGDSTNSVRLLFTFNNIPAGLTFSNDPVSSTAACTPTSTSGAVAIVAATNGTVTSTTNTLQIEITGDMDLNTLDTITITCGFAHVSSTATLPFAPATITATVTLAPTGTALASDGVTPLTSTTTGGRVPRYTSSPLPSPALPVVHIIAAQTNMLYPYISVGNGFDTGLTVGNTTGDPYGGPANGGARPQGGTVAVYFFPAGGTPFCVTTGGTATNPIQGGTGAVNCTVLTTVGLGLSTGGVVAAGSSWVVLASEIFKQVPSAPSVFNGYAFAIANFTNAHPLFFVADATFSGGFASGGPGLVLETPQIAPRTGVGGVESLGH